MLYYTTELPLNIFCDKYVEDKLHLHNNFVHLVKL